MSCFDAVGLGFIQRVVNLAASGQCAENNMRHTRDARHCYSRTLIEPMLLRAGFSPFNS